MHEDIGPCSDVGSVQGHLSILDTFGTGPSVLIREVSSFQR